MLSLATFAKNGRDTGKTGGGLIVSGANYDRFGNRKSGLGSLQDGAVIKRNEQKLNENLGNLSYRFQALDNNNVPMPNASINIANRLFNSDAQGRFVFVDDVAVEYKLKIIEEREKYIDKILLKCIFDDEITAGILGMNKQDFLTICSPAMNFETYTAIGISADLATYTCNPSYLKTLAKESVLWTTGASKLRAIVAHVCPIFDEDASSKTAIEAGTD